MVDELFAITSSLRYFRILIESQKVLYIEKGLPNVLFNDRCIEYPEHYMDGCRTADVWRWVFQLDLVECSHITWSFTGIYHTTYGEDDIFLGFGEMSLYGSSA